MKKIGLILAYQGVNYGMLLQAYATQKFIESKGFNTEILEYTRTNYKHIRKTPWLIVYAFDELRKRLEKRRKQQSEILDQLHKNNIQERKIVSKEFIELELDNRRIIKGIEALEEIGKTYNGVLVGSDQIWPPDAAFGNFTTLRFVPDDINKISYATSLGVSSYPYYCKSSAAQFWKRINYLSVREEQGKRIIQNICDIPVEVVVDPTYLFTYEQWRNLVPEQRIIDDEYILCYFLGEIEEHKKLARKYANKVGKKLVTILSTESVSDIDETFADDVIIGKGPKDFINLIRFANCILTDSFHGLAFSVINKKQFYIFFRTKIGSKNSRNSRIENILKMWNLEERLVLNDASVSDFCDKPIQYSIVDERVDKERARSISYLEKALGDCK